MRKTIRLIAIVALAACTGEASVGPGTPNGRILLPVQGNHQEASVGQKLPQQLQVQVLDADRNPVSGATVQWSATSGTIGPSSVANVEGIASAEWQLGKIPGTVTATAEIQYGSPVVFTASAIAVPPSFIVELRAPATVRGTRLLSGELECTYGLSAHAFGGADGDSAVWRRLTSYWTRTDGLTRSTPGDDPAALFGARKLGAGQTQHTSMSDRWDGPFTVRHLFVYEVGRREARGAAVNVSCTD